MAGIPEKLADIFERAAFAHLATSMSDGSPQVSPVWVELDGSHLVINSAVGRVKDRNMRANPKVALSILDPDNPYRGLTIRGRVVEITTDGAEEHVDRMAQKYINQPRYPYRAPGEVRVLYRIEPTSVNIIGG